MKVPKSFRIASIFLVASALFVSAAEKPNIIFLFADDLSYEAVRAFGHTDIDTPNLDRLVNGGTTFSHAYNPGSWSPAVCMPSRLMLNTGRFLWNAKKVEKTLKAEAEEGRLWSQQMHDAGYKTYMAGKWHVPIDPKSIFNTVANERPGMPNQTPDGYNRPVEGKPDKWSPFDKTKGGYWKGGRHWSEVLRDDALGFLETAQAHPDPFFMYIAFNAAHDPRQAPKEFVDRYPLERVKVPQSFIPQYPYMEGIGAGKGLRDEQLAPFPRTEYSVKVNRQEYYALITHMDTQIGAILDAVEKSGKADNTWIFFSADHGLSVGHHGLIGKQNMYDDSVRVPFMVMGPGVPAGKTISDAIYYQDVMPTTLALAGVEIPAFVDFQSLLPIIEGQGKTKYAAIFGAYMDRQRAITKDGWKLILYPKAKKVRLFHLAEDPLEMNDLAEEPVYEEKVGMMMRELKSLQIEVADPLDLGVVMER